MPIPRREHGVRLALPYSVHFCLEWGDTEDEEIIREMKVELDSCHTAPDLIGWINAESSWFDMDVGALAIEAMPPA